MSNNTLLRAILAVLGLTLVLVGSTMGRADAESGAITYCETNKVGQHYETVIELDTGDNWVVTDIRRGWSPFLGEWTLIESPVHPNQRRVMDCMIRRVNGERTAVLTTRGGAEWHVTNPWTEW